jgi:hypothetical protein
MPLLLTYFHLYSKKHVLQGTSSESSGKCTKQSKRKHKAESIFQKCAKERNGESPPTHLTWAEYHHGLGPGPSRNQPDEGDHEAGPPGCERNPTTSSWTSFGWRLHAAMQRRLRVVSLFSHTKPTWIHYIREGGAHLTTHNIIWSYTSHHLLCFFSS